jgi:hypothetical protein
LAESSGIKGVTLKRYIEMTEGLWLADKNAAPGVSKINPFPATQAQLKRTRPKPVNTLPPFTPPKPVKATITKVGTVVPNLRYPI